MPRGVLDVDSGTSSGKGTLIASAGSDHDAFRPPPGLVEMDAWSWREEFSSTARDLASTDGTEIISIGASRTGPCVLVTDRDCVSLWPAILYGVNIRADGQIARLAPGFGAEAILDRCGSELSTQAAGPKLAWIAERMGRLFIPASWLVWRLTGSYILDLHSASQCSPLCDAVKHTRYESWVTAIGPDITIPDFRWPSGIARRLAAEPASVVELTAGIPVITGTIDAWHEAVSDGAQNPCDLMLMYGSTMYLINAIANRITVPGLWGTVGAFEATCNLAGGMAAPGAVTGRLRAAFRSPSYEELLADAAESGAGARGMPTLPYFAGERTPIAGADARGIIAGLAIGATYGPTHFTASTIEPVAIDDWNPIREQIEPCLAVAARYEELYGLYPSLYEMTTTATHALVAKQREPTPASETRGSGIDVMRDIADTFSAATLGTQTECINQLRPALMTSLLSRPMPARRTVIMMNLDLSGKTALITAASSGIGLATAKMLAEQGASLWINGRSADRLTAARLEILAVAPAARVQTVLGDVSTMTGVQAVIDAVTDLDILIPMAGGTSNLLPFIELTDEAWQYQWDYNVMQGVRLARHYVPQLLGKDFGRIIFMASEAGIVTPPNVVDYGVAKAAVIRLSRVVAEIFAGSIDVTVNCVVPGSIKSAWVSGMVAGRPFEQVEREYFAEQRPTSLIKRFAEAEAVASLIAYLCSPASTATRGAVLRAEGGGIRTS